MSIALAPYALRVLSRDPENAGYARLSQLGGKDALNLLVELFGTDAQIVADTDRIVSYSEPLLDADRRTISVLVHTGEFGYAADLVNSQTMQLAYSRKGHDAELLPFFAFFEVPQTGDEAIVVLERFRQFGIKTVLNRAIQEHFDSRIPGRNFVVQLHPLVPGRALEELQTGRVTTIRYIRYNNPNDLADRVADGPHIEEEASMEVVTRSRRNRSAPGASVVKRILGDPSRIAEMYELVDGDYDTVKVEFEIGKRRRTVNLMDYGEMKATLDITNEVKIADSGHPKRESIETLATELAQDIRSDLDGTGGV